MSDREERPQFQTPVRPGFFRYRNGCSFEGNFDQFLRQVKSLPDMDLSVNQFQ